MATSYLQIQRQIEILQQKAEKLKAQEIAGVIERIKVAISHYGLNAEQLGLEPTRRLHQAQVKVRSGNSRKATKYADDHGNEWGGRGPRPGWLRDALAAGRSLDEFAARLRPPSEPKAVDKAKVKPTSKRSAQKYRDQNGNSWSGFGPKPRWLKDAISSGATPEQFAVK